MTKPRPSGRSRSPPGTRRSSVGDPQRTRSHSNPRPAPSYHHDVQSHHSAPPISHGRGRSGSGDSSHSDNYSINSGGSKRHREGPGGDKTRFLKRNQMKPDKRMSERGLEEQIVELSQFLEHDSARFKSQQVRSRMRVSTNSSRSQGR